MQQQLCPGLAGDWLNGWLAAIGITLLLPDSKLAWVGGAAPVAVIHHPAGEPLSNSVAAALPDVDDLERLAIAERATEPHVTGQNWTCDEYRRRAALARAQGDPSVGACYTDLIVDRATRRQTVGKSRFNPGAQGANPIAKRLRDCRGAVGEPVQDSVAATLRGAGRRVQTNGLGFDYRRLTAAGPHVDPVIELLAFAALTIVPVRGGGPDLRARGWSGRPAVFRWPTWAEALDVAAIDALLDEFWSGRLRSPVFGPVFESVSYRQMGTSDANRGYASRRVQP
jgi:hypothetical protein